MQVISHTKTNTLNNLTKSIARDKYLIIYITNHNIMYILHILY